MGVDVENGLAGRGPRVENETIRPATVLVGQRLSTKHDLSKELGVTGRELGDIREFGCLGNDQDVHWRQLFQRNNGDESVVLEKDCRGKFARNDASEDRRFCNGNRTILSVLVHQRPSFALSTAIAAGPAVEVRKTVSPSFTRVAPAATSASNS